MIRFVQRAYTVAKIAATGIFGFWIGHVINLVICSVAPLSALSEWSILYAGGLGFVIGILIGMMFPAYPLRDKPHLPEDSSEVKT